MITESTSYRLLIDLLQTFVNLGFSINNVRFYLDDKVGESNYTEVPNLDVLKNQFNNYYGDIISKYKKQVTWNKPVKWKPTHVKGKEVRKNKEVVQLLPNLLELGKLVRLSNVELNFTNDSSNSFKIRISENINTQYDNKLIIDTNFNENLANTRNSQIVKTLNKYNKIYNRIRNSWLRKQYVTFNYVDFGYVNTDVEIWGLFEYLIFRSIDKGIKNDADVKRFYKKSQI